MKNNYEYKSVNTSIRKIIKNVTYLRKIEDVVNRANLLVIQSFLFLKFYFLYISDEKNISVPEINESFIKLIFKVLYCKNNETGANSIKAKESSALSENEALYNQLKKFKNKIYNKVLIEVPPIDNTSID